MRDLGDNNAMIVRHHGLLTTGRTVGDAFYEMYYLEQAAACRSPPRKHISMPGVPVSKIR